MNDTKRFRVEPGSKVDLNGIDPGFHGEHDRKADAAKDLQHHLDRITKFQRELYGEKKHALLIVLQGIDCAGKDGTCWHVMNAMDPLGVHVAAFKQPTEEERGHDFLWRIHPHAPGKGRVTIFNRSHYEDVLAVRVNELAPRHVWQARYDAINEWERLLAKDNNTTILKFFLYISKKEQLKRFKERLDDPTHQWKISETDYSDRDIWNDYIQAFEAMLERCSTGHAPWFIIPSNHKWFRNLAVSSIIADALEEMRIEMPKPTVDLEKIRALYKKAKDEDDAKNTR